MKGKVTDEMYDEYLQDIDEREKAFDSEIKDLGNREQIEQQVIGVFDFLNRLQEKFDSADNPEKRALLCHLGQNFRMRDCKPSFDLFPWLEPIKNRLEYEPSEKSRLEPEETLSMTTQKIADTSASLQWCTRQDLNL